MTISQEFQAHLDQGLTTLARAWAVQRPDGQVFGFTDHDLDLTFEDVVFKADTGLSASALEQSTGLSVDNTEAFGALSDIAISEIDIEAGRFDGAEVTAWLVNWADVSQRTKLFLGTIGEMRRVGGAFHAELRGLSEALQKPQGRVYQKPCTAVLGDRKCGFDLDADGYSAELDAEIIEQGRVFRWAKIQGFEEGWFARGHLRVLSGAAKGLDGVVKRDRFVDGTRVIELWEPIRLEIKTGDILRLDAGCDKRFETCRLKFANFLNFQGFPDIPGEDWLTAYPSDGGVFDGGSLRS